MISKTLALVIRALRVDVREKRSHLFRGALAAIILWMLMLVQARSWAVSAPGRDFFSSITWLNYWFITIAGASFFASAITEEKEERTLSLLKMADIGALSILFGKWTPRLIGAMLLVMIQVPFTALAITLGGVLWQQIAAVYVALLAHLFLVGNLGLLASVFFSRTSYATTAMVCFLVGWHIVPDLMQGLGSEVSSTDPVAQLIKGVLLSVGGFFINLRTSGRLSSALATGFSEGIFTFQVAGNLILGALAFLVAWGIFEPCTRNEVEPLEESQFWSRLRHFGRRGHNRRVWSWPIVWQGFYYVGGGPVGNLLKFAAYFVFLMGTSVLFFWNDLARGEWEALGAIFFSWSLFFLVLETAILTARAFRDELQRKTWPTLTLLPIPLPEILYSKLTGSLLALIPVTIWMVFGACVWGEDFFEGLSSVLSEPQGFLFFCYFCLQVLLGIHLSTYLSILAAWAIWPVAIATSGFITVMFNIMFFGCLWGIAGPGGDSETGVALICCLISCGLISGLHLLIGLRLARLAAEE